MKTKLYSSVSIPYSQCSYIHQKRAVGTRNHSQLSFNHRSVKFFEIPNLCNMGQKMLYAGLIIPHIVSAFYFPIPLFLSHHLRILIFFRNRKPQSFRRFLIDDDFQHFRILYGSILCFDFPVKHIRRHVSCLYTRLVEIYGERAERAVFRHAVRTYEYGNLSP